MNNYKMIRIYYCLLFLSICAHGIRGQSYFIERTDPQDHFLDRWEIKYGLSANIHTSAKGIKRSDVILAASNLPLNRISSKDLEDLKYVLRDNSEFSYQPISVNPELSKIQYLDSLKGFSFQLPTENHFYHPYTSADRYKGFLGMYKDGTNMLRVDADGFTFRINPILNFSLGKENIDNSLIFQNQRGIELKGIIDSIFLHN